MIKYQRWETRSIGSTNFEAEEIKQAGLDGWEFVTVVTILMQESPLRPPITMPVFMFKRPLPNLELES